MTVAVCCVLADGVILGVDSAVTIGDPANPFKVYEGSEKIFQLGNLPVGVAIYGAGSFGMRSIGNILREFEIVNPSGVLTSANANLQTIVEEMRLFFMQRYTAIVVPEIEAQLGIPFTQVPDEQKPALGLIVGGYSGGAYLPEAWQIIIPAHTTPGSAVQISIPGQMGSSWFATFGPIRRYIKGIDPEVFGALISAFNQLRTPQLTDAEVQDLMSLVSQFEYQTVFVGMPITLGIEYARFLVDLVIGHHRFAVGASIVGGKARIGVVTYRSEAFTIV